MNGNLCGLSTGEALSRWCASVIGNNALSDFTTAPQWAQDGMQDFVNQTDGSDTNPDSTGCGMAFISWLMSLGHGLDKIAQTMVSLGDAGTLAQLYANLTADAAANGWPNFQAAIQNLQNGVTSDDPFAAAPKQLANVAPWTVAVAGKVFAAILADLAAGKPAQQIVASVQAALGPSAVVKMAKTAKPAVCEPRSRRLRPPERKSA
jgi:hypothetical protein